jgi:(p)ppGpp synthase/HD superfamily hydrolase
MPTYEYPPPINRETMRGMKAAKEEKERKKKEEELKYGVYRRATQLYGEAQRLAESGSMRHEVALNQVCNPFHGDLVLEIVNELRRLFPDCSVELTLKDKNGAMRIVTNMDLTVIIPQFIVIDWS